MNLGTRITPSMPRIAALGRRRLVTIAMAVACVALVPSAALAVLDPDGPSTEFTGCVKTNGTIYNVAVGEAPKASCQSNETEIHMKSGDVTAVVAGIGMTGGASSGPATLSIAPAYRLPQGCANGQVAKQYYGSWGCFNDSDTNTTYNTSTGLSMSGTTMSIAPSYQLPQTCIPGQHVQWVNSTTRFGCTWLPSDAGEVPFAFGPYSVTFSGAGKACLGTPNTPIPVSGNSYTTSAFTLPAGKWRPVLAGNSRWSIYQVADLDNFSRKYVGEVTVEILNANNVAVSTFARNAQSNGLGDGQHADQDFGSFTSTGGQYHIKLSVSATGCTSAQLLDFKTEFEKVD